MDQKRTSYLLSFSVYLTCISLSPAVRAQSSYDEFINYFKDYDFKERVVPVIPPKGATDKRDHRCRC